MGERLQTAAAIACMKTLLMVFNFIFWITGVGFLVIGILAKTAFSQYIEFYDDSTENLNTSAYVLIGVGSAIIVFGSMGCCCTIKRNSFLLYLYATFLFVIFLAEIAAGATGYKFRDRIRDGFNTGLTTGLQRYVHTEKDYPEMSQAIDNLQQSLRCCGVQSYIDWEKTPYGQFNKGVPESCCIDNKRCDISFNPSNSTGIYQEGCVSKISGFVEGNFGVIGGAALGIAFFQLIGVLFACCLAKNVNKAPYERVS